MIDIFETNQTLKYQIIILIIKKSRHPRNPALKMLSYPLLAELGLCFTASVPHHHLRKEPFKRASNLHQIVGL
jgi:hypothetical protein